MTHKTSKFDEIISRRIPHILGMYIAAVWLSVEIADWMSDRFGVSNQFSSYVFIGMLSFIPSVIMLAWGHGRPGRDRWSKIEITWIPINIGLSLFAIQLFFTSAVNPQLKSKPQPSALTSVAVKPMGSEPAKIEVSNNSHHSVLSFFWENNSNDPQLNWLSYGASWMFSQDLKRTPNISVSTPYGSRGIIAELKSKGFSEAINIPMSLALQVADKNSKKWMVMGSFAFIDGNYQFEARLYNVKSAAIERVISSTDTHLLRAIDQVSNKIGLYLLEFNHADINIIPDLTIEDHTSKNLNAIKMLIEAKNKVAFNNDYNGAIELILKALELDASFAEANVLATSYYQAQGDYANAIKQSKKALTLDYKIYQESVYALKANMFEMLGEQAKSLLVLETWVKLYPGNPIAHAELAKQYLFSNDQLDKAESEFKKLLSIEGENHNTLVELGRIYRVRGEKEKTITVLERFLSANPEKVEAYIELANAYKQFSMFDKAIAMYKQASIIGSKDFEAEIGVANTIAIRGDYQLALNQLDDLLANSQTDNEKLQLLNAKILIYSQTGQIENASKTLDLLEQPAKKILPPLAYMLTMDGSRIQLFILLGQYKEALNYAELLKSNTKPPFNDIVSVFSILTYFAMEDQKKFAEELESFELFLKEFPMPFYEQFVMAWKGRISYWDGDLQGSIQQLDQAISGSRQSIMALRTFHIVDELIYNKAIVLFELGQHQKALSELNFVLNRNPLFAKAHTLMARIYQQQNQLDKSQESIQKVLNLWKNADSNFVDLIELNQFIESSSSQSNSIP